MLSKRTLRVLSLLVFIKGAVVMSGDFDVVFVSLFFSFPFLCVWEDFELIWNWFDEDLDYLLGSSTCYHEPSGYILHRSWNTIPGVLNTKLSWSLELFGDSYCVILYSNMLLHARDLWLEVSITYRPCFPCIQFLFI